ncbi:MAG: NUDIX hydrolase [Candidatus Zipacnadales bacterium]
MTYMQELRKLVGSRPLIMVAAGIVILDEQERILLQKRVDTGEWDIPGGAMEPGESVEETARREIREETGLEVGEMELLGVFSGPEMFHQYPNGDQVYIVAIRYLTRDFTGKLTHNLEEGTELRFFPLDDLPSAISGPDRVILRRLFERVGR